MAKQIPSVGRIVHYLPNVEPNAPYWAMRLKPGQTVPAIITEVGENERVALTVFVPGFDSTWGVQDVPLRADETDIAPGQWQWPPFV